MIRKLSAYVSILVIVLITLTVLSLPAIATTETENTNSNILNEELLQHTLFSDPTNANQLQSAHIPNPHFSESSEPLPCFGPHISAYIDKTAIEINQSVTITGKINPPEPNTTVRICYIRPNYSWIEDYVPVDPETGEFSHTQMLDMVGYWNIFTSHGHISDRMHTEVSDPLGTSVIPDSFVNPWKANIPLVAMAAAIICIGIIFAITGIKKKKRRISSLKLCIQIILVCLIFTGMFVDHQNLPRPVRQMAVQELLIGEEVFGVAMPEGFPAPFLACYYPCGRTVTCTLYEMQTYIYPFIGAGHGWGVDYNTSGVARLAVVFGSLILASLLLGRAWCGWVCPFGLYLDILAYIRKHLKVKRVKLSDRVNKCLPQLSYVILAVILIVSVVFASYAITGTQLVPGTEEGGFVNMFYSAPFCTVCPMKPLCLLMQNQAGVLQTDWIATGTGDFYQLGRYLTSVNLLVLGIVTVVAFFISRFWCRICPLGGLIGLFSKVPPFKWISVTRLVKDKEKCTKCGICKRVCPMQVNEVYEKDKGDVMTTQCIACLHCIEMCPYSGALKFQFAGKTVCRSQDWLVDDVKTEVVDNW
jgi:NAD-dependent dihydropyrimidine dehydrogenase PreA subunit